VCIIGHSNKIKNKKIHIPVIGTIPKSNRNLQKEAKLITLTHIYMTIDLPGLVQALQYKAKKLVPRHKIIMTQIVSCNK
jgi:hypothetical protein